MSRVRGWLEVLVRHPVLKVISFFFAMVIWLYVQREQVVQQAVRATVDWTLPESLVLADSVPEEVVLTVEGSRAALRRAQLSDVVITADLSQATIGSTPVEFISLPRTGLPQMTEVKATSPSTATVVLDEQDTRNVEVVAATVGDPATGYGLGPIKIDPAVVEVKGPRTVVAEMQVVTTLPIDVSGLSAWSEPQVQLDLPRGVKLADPDRVLTARIPVEALFAEEAFSGVRVVSPDQDWEVLTTEVKVVFQGPQAKLDQLDLKASSAVLAVVHLPDNPSRSRYEVPFGPRDGLRLEIVYPYSEEVEVVTVEPSVVEVRRK